MTGLLQPHSISAMTFNTVVVALLVSGFITLASA